MPKPKPQTVELVKTSYQPTKAELEEERSPWIFRKGCQRGSSSRR